MPAPAAMQLAALRKLYAKAHQQLQEAGTRIIRLQDRIAALEAENARLRGDHRSHTEQSDAVR